MKYLVHDFETGGLENTSVLTYYGAITDEKFNILDEIELNIRPEDGKYIITPEALKINKINIIEHYNNSISKNVCVEKITDFLLKNTKYKSEKLYTVGHNVHFDNFLLKSHFLNSSYSDFFFHHSLDVASIALLLKIVGRLPKDLNISLTNLAKYYKIDTSNAHESKADVLITIAVLKCITKEINL